MEPTHESAEQRWLAALRSGDEGALRAIFNRHYPLLLGDIYRIIADQDTCKDLAQEVFVELWKKRKEIDIHTSLRAYLRRAGVNRALNYLKSNKRFQIELNENLIPDSADTTIADRQEQDARENLENALGQALDTLPEKCRAVFSLSRFEQLSHKEIAEQLGISTKTVENQITKAMKILREFANRHRDLSQIVILCLICSWLA
jgi:RNA polymerase sigma-70 factor (ECF subfamily)